MILTESNYHSQDAAKLYLSASAVKRAKRCESEFLTGHPDEDKSAFVAGHMFELLVTQDDAGIAALHSQHPEMFSSRSPTAGQLKSEYQNVVECAYRVRKQRFLCHIIDRSQKQVIMTGTIFGKPFRMMCDLFYVYGDVVDIYDLKTAKNFSRMWSDADETYVEWWDYWNYPMQMWIYRELASQNGYNVRNVGIIGVSKANYDIQAFTFSEDTLLGARADVEYTLGRIEAISSGDEPIRCEHCPHCIETKKIERFEVI